MVRGRPGLRLHLADYVIMTVYFVAAEAPSAGDRTD
jgi:hypothetical protein